MAEQPGVTTNHGDASGAWAAPGAALALTRPVNCALAALSVWVGAVASGAPAQTWAVGMAALAAAAITAAGNGLNDVLDLPVDRRNRPRRPLPSGRLSSPAALLLSAVLGAGGLSLAWIVGPGPGLIALGVSLGLAAYNWALKRTGVPGNLVVALLAAATFPFGAVAAGSAGRWWIPAGFALAYHLGREFIKGAEDIEGDALVGVRTLARRRGPRAAARAAVILFGLVVLAAPIPALVGIYGGAYLLPVIALDALLIGLGIRLWHQPPPPGTSSTSRWLLPGMALGLLAVVLGEWIDRV